MVNQPENGPARNAPKRPDPPRMISWVSPFWEPFIVAVGIILFLAAYAGIPALLDEPQVADTEPKPPAHEEALWRVTLYRPMAQGDDYPYRTWTTGRYQRVGDQYVSFVDAETGLRVLVRADLIEQLPLPEDN